MVVYTNLVRSPRGTNAALWSAGGLGTGAATESVVTGASDGPVMPDGTQITSYIRYTITTATSTAGTYLLTNNPTAYMKPFAAGTGVATSFYMRVSQTSTWYPRRWTYLASAAASSQQGPPVEVQANTWTRLEHHDYLAADADYFRISPIASTALPAGLVIEITAVLCVADVDLMLPFFDGSSPNTALVTHAWAGAIEASESTRTVDAPIRIEREMAGKVDVGIMLSPVIRKSFDRAEADLSPFYATHVRADEAPIFNGYPKATSAWVRVRPVLSAEGLISGANRPRPGEVSLDSDVRFIAGEDYFNESTGVWTPHNSNRQNYYMRGPNLLTTPLLEEYTYISGREVITNGAFRISDGTSFLCEFHDGLDSYNAMTLSMVIAPNPQVQSYPLVEWYHQSIAPTPQTRLAMWLGDKIDYYWAGTGGSVDQVVAFNKTRPLFVTAVIDPPMIRVTAAYSPRHQYTTSKATALGVNSQYLRMRMGGAPTTLTTEQLSDFNLFEVNLWDRALSVDEIAVLNSTYASIYGVASEWR